MPSITLRSAADPAIAHALPVEPGATVADVCDMLFSLTDVAPSDLRLRHGDIMLNPTDKLVAVGVHAGTELHYHVARAPGTTGNVPSTVSQAQVDELAHVLGDVLRVTVAPPPSPRVDAARELVRRVEAYWRRALEHEDPALQQLARDTMPLAQLREEAAAAMTAARRNSKGDDGGKGDDKGDDKGKDEDKNKAESTCADLALTRALLRWFKRSFFTWVDAPACAVCGAEKTNEFQRVDTAATPDERAGRADRVEVYACKVCGGGTRFPRYTDGAALLRSRRGRCGEWAQAFTLCALAAGLRARVVHDWTDHVWTEVWSGDGEAGNDNENGGRWVHADACEECLDEPHLYEKGWGKQLTFCVATGADCVADVTPRYAPGFDAARRRRGDVHEGVVAAGLARLDHVAARRGGRAAAAAARRRAEADARDVLGARAVGGALAGRQSGAREWVRARGEDGGGGDGDAGRE